MNKFEEKIAKARAESGRQILEGTGISIGELVSAILDIDNIEDAVAFYEGYLEHMKGRSISGQTPESAARLNIGWCFGEGMDPTRIEMWVKACGASHPVFGTKAPSLKEAFFMGRKAGKGQKEPS